MSKIESFARSPHLPRFILAAVLSFLKGLIIVPVGGRFISLEGVNYSSCGNYGSLFTWG